MILAVDAGNTRLKWGWHDGRDWASIGSIANGELASSFRPPCFGDTGWTPERIVVSSVAGDDVRRLVEERLCAFAVPARWVRASREEAGVRNLYDEPQRLGPDRWAALIAARTLHRGSTVVVNAGTATTVDRLSPNGEFLGGMILPGVDLMRRALHEHTGGLPFTNGSFEPLPRNTADAIETGCRSAQAGAVERARREAGPESLCLVSGGDGRALADLLGPRARFVDHLVLLGLLRMTRQE